MQPGRDLTSLLAVLRDLDLLRDLDGDPHRSPQDATEALAILGAEALLKEWTEQGAGDRMARRRGLRKLRGPG